MTITTIMNIETSSVCDNSCRYCPAKDQAKRRKTGLMSMDTYSQALHWVRRCLQKGTQTELNLFGVGEPTLNPEIVEMVAMARDLLPERVPVHLNTNGNTMTWNLAAALKGAGVTAIDVTGHDAHSAANAIRMFKQLGIKGQVSFDFITSPNDWAGQVDWFKADYSYPCPWLHKGQAFVMSDGTVARCCIDAFATEPYGTVWDDLFKFEVGPIRLCERCHSTPPVKGGLE
jgi:hypothetical protein